MCSIPSVIFFASIFCVVCTDKSPSIVIVGAGVSGISAAVRLVENGFNDVKVLEAKNRIGGRIHSVTFGTGKVDLGAQFCYGKEGNAVFDLVKGLDLLDFYPLQHNLFYSSGEKIEHDFVRELTQIFGESYVATKGDVNASIGEGFINRYNRTILERYKNDNSKLNIAFDSLQLFIKYVTSIDGALSVFDVSAQRDSQYHQENLLLNWKNLGFESLLDVLLENWPNLITEKVNFNKQVIEITWESQEFNISSVKCSDGTTYQANHIIVTLPLGVLKESSKILFVPPLPDSKISAIETLGIGAIAKIFLHFPDEWWRTQSNDFTDFNFVWKAEDEEALKMTIKESDKMSLMWLLDLILLYRLDENPKILVACFSGHNVPYIEQLSDEEIIDGIVLVLTKFLENIFDNTSKPDAIIRDKWYTDEHFRGTSSFQTIQSRLMNPSAEIALAEPVNSTKAQMVLLFAGEATHPVYYSTVHGALETGYREAKRIIDYYK